MTSTSSFKHCFLPCLGVALNRHQSAPDDLPSPCSPEEPSPSVPPPQSPPLAAASKRERRIVSLESGRLLFLTAEDLEVISSLWAKIPEKHLWSQRLFLKMFSLKPSFTKIMHYEGMQVKQVMQCERFQRHCRRFIDFWDQLICAVSTCRLGAVQNRVQRDVSSETGEGKGDPEISFAANARVVGQVRAIGRLHCEMPGVTFDAESWLLFKNVLLESVCGQRRDSLKSLDQDKSWISWCKLVTFVVSEMKDAFNEGIRTRSNTM